MDKRSFEDLGRVKPGIVPNGLPVLNPDPSILAVEAALNFEGLHTGRAGLIGFDRISAAGRDYLVIGGGKPSKLVNFVSRRNVTRAGAIGVASPITEKSSAYSKRTHPFSVPDESVG
jgi:hypothetical protein